MNWRRKMLNIKVVWAVSEDIDKPLDCEVYCAQLSDKNLAPATDSGSHYWRIIEGLLKTFRGDSPELSVSLSYEESGRAFRSKSIREYAVTITQVTVPYLENNPKLIESFGNNWKYIREDHALFFIIETVRNVSDNKYQTVRYGTWEHCCSQAFQLFDMNDSNIVIHFTFKNC